jgi:hypothetical protein
MNTNQKPNLITVIAVTTLVSGIVNLFWGLVASMAAIGTIIGIVCLPLAILPVILGIFEIIYATKMLSNPPQPLQPSNNIAVFEILCFLTGNIFSMVVGILSLIFYNDVTVKNYFVELNATQTPPPAAPKPAPVLPAIESAPEPILLDPPAEPESPAQSKRGRKVA